MVCGKIVRKKMRKFGNDWKSMKSSLVLVSKMIFQAVRWNTTMMRKVSSQMRDMHTLRISHRQMSEKGAEKR